MTTQPHNHGPDLISPGDFAIVARILKRMTGIHLSPNKRAMVSGRLSKRLKALGLHSVSAYCAALQSPGNDAEKDAFVSALTTNMTRFQREDHHFTHLRETVLPDLIRTARNGGRVRLWSAGCSTGEEAYDIAIQVLQACPNAARMDIRVLATDIDKSALAAALAGLYPVAGLAQLPDEIASGYFDRQDAPAGMARVQSAARELVSFRWLNLDSKWPFRGKFDAIMCRNVAIYFDDETQSRLWRRLAERLQMNGVLYTGHSEVLPGDVLDRTRHEGSGTFRLQTEALTTHAAAGQRPQFTETTDELERQTSHPCG